jgi:hypothetical protein
VGTQTFRDDFISAGRIQPPAPAGPALGALRLAKCRTPRNLVPIAERLVGTFLFGASVGSLEDVMSFERYRDRNGDLSLKYGNILMRTFRQYYGPAFGKGCGDNERLSDVLHKLEEGSLSELVKDDEAGRLEQVSRTST